ncbi:exopolysaccharide transport family protein [Sinorhizobium sp. BG8]|uniref:GumC family protein n=1 Tax=Sinorhizobium sp. BG8 TaxID=2613773 RepID=UPI00193CCF66|nr:exopolysaccharide transport family protein [Sinorhizobium sp. BG8]
MLTTDRTLDAYTIRNRQDSLGAGSPRAAFAYGLQDVLAIILRYKRFLVCFIAAGILFTILLNASLTKIYTASSALVFDRNDNRPYEVNLQFQTQARDKSAMETEMDNLRSRVFVGNVVDALKLVEDPTYNTYLPPPKRESDTFLGSLIDSVINFMNGAGDGDAATPQRRIVSESVQRNRAISKLLSTFSADRKGDSLALTIHVQQANPLQAAAIADAIAEQYVLWTSKLKIDATEQTVAYLRNQAAELATGIADKERQIAAFTGTSDLTFDPKDDLIRARMEQLNEQLTIARVDEAGAWAKFNEAKLRLASTGKQAVGRVVTSELLDNLRKEEATLERQRAQLSAKFGRNHPLVQDTDAQLETNRRMIGDEASRITQELENDAKIASVRVSKFSAEVGVLQERMKSRNLAEIRRRELERDLLSDQKRYDQVILRLGTIDPAKEDGKPSSRIASYAEVPTVPTFPVPSLLFTAGIIGFMILGVLIVIIRDALDTRLYRPLDVEALIDRPNLASVPDMGKALAKGQSVYQHMLGNPDSALDKAARAVCLAWRKMDHAPGDKVLMLCSARPGEGKTAFALAMAATAKTNGMRTVLIDLNPGPESASKQVGTPASDSALSRYLDGRGELGEVASVSASYPFLEVISLRPGLQDYDRLFEGLRDRYDLIIVDPPAIESSEDSVWLASQVDSIIMVVKSASTKQRSVKDALERLSLNHPVILGSVTNFLGKAPSAQRGTAWIQRVAEWVAGRPLRA